MKLYKAMCKDGPDSETRRKDISWRDGKEKNGWFIV
jgi:hypothetical protein